MTTKVQARGAATVSKAEKRRRANKKAAIVTICIVGLLVILPFTMPYILGAFAYPIVKSEGERVGQVIKLSNKGIVWKTWEGSLGITQSGAYAEEWNFSIDPSMPDEAELVADLKAAADTGNIIKVSYKQHVGIRPWNGKTSYLIEDVQVLGNEYYRTPQLKQTEFNQ